MAQGLETLTSLGGTFFWSNRMAGICLENASQQLCILIKTLPPNESSPQVISVHPVVDPISLPPHGRLAPSQRSFSKLFPTVSCPFTLSSLPSCSLPTAFCKLYNYFPRFHMSVHPVVPSVSLPANRAFPKLCVTVSCCSPQAFPKGFMSVPEAIAHGFPSVHSVVTCVSLPAK